MTELQNLQLATQQLQQLTQTTLAPSYLQESASENTPTYAQLIDPQHNFNQIRENLIEFQEQVDQEQHRIAPNEEPNLINYQTYHDYEYRQTQNDKILRQAQQEQLEKQKLQEQHEQSALELHQSALVEQFKHTPLRIIVPDEDNYPDVGSVSHLSRYITNCTTD